MPFRSHIITAARDLSRVVPGKAPFEHLRRGLEHLDVWVVLTEFRVEQIKPHVMQNKPHVVEINPRVIEINQYVMQNNGRVVELTLPVREHNPFVVMLDIASPGVTAADNFRRGCAAGDAEGCWSLGLLTLADKNDQEGAHWMELACEGGAKLGCSQYVKLVEQGRGVPADPARAVALLTASCDDGNAVACNDLSMDYVTGHSVAKDTAKGVALLERSCVLGDNGQCATIAMRYERGIGVAADPTKAALYYSKACQAGIAPACSKVQGKP